MVKKTTLGYFSMKNSDKGCVLILMYSPNITQKQKAMQLHFSCVAFEFLMVKLSPSDPNIITVYGVSQFKCNVHI